MKKMLCYVIAASLGVGIGPMPLCAQEASNFSEPGTGALKQVKTAAQAAQDLEKPKKEDEKPSSVPLDVSAGAAKQTVSQMSSRPEVAWVYHSKPDAPKSLFARSIAERMQEGSLQGPVSNPPGDSAAVAPSAGLVTAELPMSDTSSAPGLLAVPDAGASTSLPVVSPSVSTSPTSSEPAQGGVTRPVNAPSTDKPASQPGTTSSPTDGFDQQTLDLLPSAIFAASVSGEGQAGASALAGPSAMTGPKEAVAVDRSETAQGARGAGANEESVRRLGQRGTAVEKLAGGPSKGGASKSGLLSANQSAQTGWFDTLRARVNRGNVSDMKEREGEADQMCVSFADTDGIAKMIEKSGEKAGLSEDHPRVLYAYGHGTDNIVFIRVVQLDGSGEPKKAARLFADGRVQVFGQLKKQDILGKVFGGEPVPPKEVLFTKKTYRIIGTLTRETLSQFFIDQSRGAARGPCPKAFSKK